MCFHIYMCAHIHIYMYVIYAYIYVFFDFWLAVIFSFYMSNYGPVLPYCIRKTPSQGSSRSSQEMSFQAAVSMSEVNSINPFLHSGRPCASTFYPIPYINTLFCCFMVASLTQFQETEMLFSQRSLGHVCTNFCR